MQTQLLLLFLRRVDLPHPFFITWGFDSTGSHQVHTLINTSIYLLTNDEFIMCAMQNQKKFLNLFIIVILSDKTRGPEGPEALT